MPAQPATIIPVVAKIAWDNDAGNFRMRVSTQVKRPDGTHYEVEIEVGADLGALVTTLFQIWSGTRYMLSPVSAMQQPTPPDMPSPGAVEYNGALDVGTPGDVGDANPADDLNDAVIVAGL